MQILEVSSSDYTVGQMTYDRRRLRLNGILYRPRGIHRYFLTPYGWKVARLFSRLEGRVLRPALAMFTGNEAVLPFSVADRWIVLTPNSTSSSTAFPPLSKAA